MSENIVSVARVTGYWTELFGGLFVCTFIVAFIVYAIAMTKDS